MMQILHPSSLLYTVLLLGLATGSLAADYKLYSPDGELCLQVKQNAEGHFLYSFTAGQEELIKPSLLGYENKKGQLIPSATWQVKQATQESKCGSWTPLWGKRAQVKDQYQALTLNLNKPEQGSLQNFNIELRAYNDGIAFRYSIPQNEGASCDISREATQFYFAGDYKAWLYNGEYANIGPITLKQFAQKRQPIMSLQAGKNQFLALHEAYLQTGEALVLSSRKDETLVEVASAPKELTAGYQSAWRVLFHGKSAGALVDSHLLELLNPDPSPEMDFSWVKPGIAVWDWRINGAKVKDFTYKMDYPSWVRMIDFASKNGIAHLVLDANWYGPEFEKDSDPLKGDKAKDVKRIITYGKSKGVGVWLYLNDVGGRQYPIEQTLKQYGDWGAAGVKYGFMRGNSVEKHQRTQMITRLCAENKLHIDYHDSPIHPYGQMRTWPNALTREYCHAQLDAHRVFTPTTFLTSVFVNMVAGPIDMNNGMFDLRQGPTDRVDESQPVPSTLVSECARTAIVFSGATILPDIPEYYEKHPSLLRFISAEQMPWVESKTLSGEIGKHIVMMRESKTHYLVAAAINEEGGELCFPLDFLPAGSYEAELTTDGEDAHYLKNRESIEVKKISVKSGEKMTLRLAPGGGACLLIHKNSPECQ